MKRLVLIVLSLLLLALVSRAQEILKEMPKGYDVAQAGSRAGEIDTVV